MDWIMSEGGPLICVQDKWRALWGGIYRLSGEGVGGRWADYDRACSLCTPHTAVIPIETGFGLLLSGEGPLDTSIGRAVSGALVIVQVVCAELGIDEEALFMNIDDAVFTHPEAMGEVSFETADLVVFDSAAPGDDADEKSLAFRLQPGRYRVLSQTYEPNPGVLAYVHKFETVGLMTSQTCNVRTGVVVGPVNAPLKAAI